MSDLRFDPMPEADETTRMVVEAMAVVKQAAYAMSVAVMTPRLAADTREQMADWLERAERWAKQKPEGLQS